VNSVYFQDTYQSLLVGRPSREMNDRIIRRAMDEMCPIWGDRRTHVVPPVEDESDPSHPVLPPVRFTAWLACCDPIQPGNAGSELVVVWFRSECLEQPLDRIISDGIHPLPWDELAQDIKAY